MATDLQQSAGLAHSSTDALQQLQSQQQAAASANRILFLVVVSGADLDCLEDPKPTGPRYTRDSLRNLLQLLGCKPRLAYKVMMGVFQAVDQAVTTARQQRISRKTFQVHPHRNGKVYVSLTRADFMSLVSSCAAQYSYKISPSSEELKVACSLRERRRCVVVLLCGTSGSGKSTLASILASRLGITTVVSTDSIRHMMRSFISKEQAPLLWASTYQAGEQLGDSDKAKKATSESELAVYGYKAQCELLSEHLELLIAGCEARTQSLICEGVHLNISTVAKLMARHPSVLPFLVFIPSESRHVERMAVRAKYMTLDPNKNRYVRYMGNIRLIQEYLVRKADKYAVPRVDNSNVDRSVGIIHLTVMSCLRRMARGEPVLDPATGKTTMLAAEYAAVLDHLQGEKDRLAAATAAANTSSSSSATNQKQQLHHLRDAVGLGQQQEAGGSSGGGRGHGKTTGLERHNPQQQQQPPQQQQRVGMQTNGSLRQSQAGPDQHPAPHAAAAMAGIPPIAEQVPGSASTYCSRQGGAGGAAVGALVAAAAVTAPSQQEQADVAGTTSRSGLMGSLPDGQEQQQGPHSSSSAELHGSHHATSSPGVGAEAGSSVEAHAGHTISSPVRSGCMLRGAAPDGQHQQHQDGQAQQVAAACAQAAQSLQQRGSQDSSGALRDGIQPHGPAQQQQDQHQEHQHTMWGPAAAQQPPPGRSSGRASSDAAGGSAVHTAELGGSTRGSSSSSSRDGHVQDGHSCGDAVAGVSSSRGSFDQQEQGDVHYEQQQQQQQEWGQREEAEEDDEDAGLVSSGEELDRLGELGSSDNEGERFIQEYGSVYESTTCDEHDDFDKAGGLMAWHINMLV